MFFSKFLAATAVVGLAAAQSSMKSAVATSTSGAMGAGQTAMVVSVSNAGGDLVFDPPSMNAPVGAVIQFQFYAKNHSVVRAAFSNPCTPIANVNSSASNAFFSGFMPTNRTKATGQDTLVYNVIVKDTSPMWYYCSQGKHCQEGMVGVINPPASGPNTIDAWKANSAKAAANLSPGQNGTNAAASGGASGTAAGGASATATGAGASSTTTGAPATSTGGAAALTGGAVGAGLAFVAALLFL